MKLVPVNSVRVRFAPSPTGPLHIGGVRTALFNYLFAKHHQGRFVLRIEDTDQSRYVPGAEAYIVEAMNWLGLPFDEGPEQGGDFGPYRQSERKELYRDYADHLVEEGKAYYAFDTPEALSLERSQYEARKETFIYNWHNRERLDNSLGMDPTQLNARLQSGAPYVIRFKTPTDQTLTFRDIIRGEIKIDPKTLDDKVLFKSDGMPTYHLANIVDDHLMEISHVIRGEEWLPSLALHVMLYDAFGWEAPQFAHLPLIMKPTGKGKLSKRDGEAGGFPVFPLQWEAADGSQLSGYRESGYLPEAVVNLLAFLGWNPGTEQELFDLQELCAAFDLSKVSKGGAKFDPEKAKWFQHQYFQKIDNTSLANDFKSLLDEEGISSSIDTLRVIELVKERASFSSDLWAQADFFYVAPEGYDEKASKKAFKEDTPQILQEVKEQIAQTEDFGASNLSDVVKGWITGQEMGFGKVMMPLRVVLVGGMRGPDVFDIMSTLGKDETIRRIETAIERIQS